MPKCYLIHLHTSDTIQIKMKLQQISIHIIDMKTIFSFANENNND